MSVANRIIREFREESYLRKDSALDRGWIQRLLSLAELPDDDELYDVVVEVCAKTADFCCLDPDAMQELIKDSEEALVIEHTYDPVNFSAPRWDRNRAAQAVDLTKVARSLVINHEVALLFDQA